MWLTFSSSYFLRMPAACRTRYLQPFVMAASTVALTLYGILVLVRDSRSKDLPSPLHSIWSLLARPEESVKVPDDQEHVPKTA